MLKKGNINPEFWDVFGIHYEKECYTDAIKDACLYLVQLVQEKSELENLDGEKLINTAFSESNPKLLINENQTQTEKDEQRGFGFLLRGIICAIRNPISHKRDFKLSKEEADSILLFINNYILPKLDDSRDFRYVQNWYDFIFTENENDSKKYSDTILSNISKKERLELMINIVNQLSFIKEGKYYYIINSLYEQLAKKEKEEIIILLNKKLIAANDGKYIRMFFNHFNPEIWNSIDKLVKVRIEEMVEKSIHEGELFFNQFSMQEETKGSLGTWTVKWICKFENEQTIIDDLYNKMNRKDEAKYVLRYFGDIVEEEKNIIKHYKCIINGLKDGKKQYKDLLDRAAIFDIEENKIIEKIKAAYNTFEEKEEVELPF